MQSSGTDRHKVPHNSFCGYDTKLFILLQLPLKNDCKHFLASLDQLEVLLIGKIKRCDLVVENSYVLVHLTFRLLQVFGHIDLVAQGDASEEFDQHGLVEVLISVKDHLSLWVVVLLSVPKLIRQILK